MHKNKTRYNGRYEIVNPKQDGALILSIHEVQKQPRIEVLLMRSPNRDGKKRESIHHLQLDSSFGNKSVVHMSGQSIQDSGEFRGPEQRVKSMDLVEEKSMNGSSISDLKIVVNEYRYTFNN